MFTKIVKYRRNFLEISNFRRKFSTDTISKQPAVVLGIETSCDDTACAIVNNNGKILSESKYSQLQFHLRAGGINPIFAQELHRLHIEDVVTEALEGANMKVTDVDAIAVTNEPGITRSLIVGVRYAKHLARKYSKPLIPVHHMEAHALTSRLENPDLKFPFLCLLASGGHCQLALVKSATEFLLLGTSIDSAPGTCFDRIARALNLQAVPEYRNVSGGPALELAASKSSNPNRFQFTLPLRDQPNCQFSFCGFRSQVIQTIDDIRNRLHLPRDEMIPYYEDLCASVLRIVTKHLLQRTQRAIHYCDRLGAFGVGATNKLDRTFVFSGGVACNDFIYRAMNEMVSQFGFKSYRSSKRLCTDNGVMIAWNGLERWHGNEEFYRNLDIDSVLPNSFTTLGSDHTELVTKKRLKCNFVKVPSMMCEDEIK
ncbi:probable tRNA N6-adenosine threonylcarbamoyltransferase, mitochondrial [Contarinia nasturtii]|uniref:probable tRNA N6-adenosine threonylcarbamoyltransferase, mitochondrial n=1 Tax=Contarinia nasturtii TaxID=265458 RepID=UPI0012D40E26|nr:probable tRNA N6-adenosine threonylcarbamoyltransferase, mitochondrial [Contarinia nasturtii]